MSEILRDGPSRRLLWGDDSSGRLRGKEYYDSLKTSDRAKFDALFNRMAEKGRIAGQERFRKESGDIYVFKIFKHRLACFFHQDDVVIIDGFVKKSDRDKRISRHIETANRLRTDYIDRHP